MAQVKEMPAVLRPQPNVSEKLEWIRMPEEADFETFKSPETFREKIFRKTKANPFVPIGIAVTTVVLSFGLYTMRTGNTKLSQKMMRARVAAQAFTIISLLGGVFFLGDRAK